MLHSVTNAATRSMGRNWLFTINNPTDGDNPEVWKDEVRFAVWQKEKGADGTPHLQGYVVLKNNKRITGMKKMNARAHWEIRKGSHMQAKVRRR